MNKIIDVITFTGVVICIGFGFQIAFLIRGFAYPLATALIPLGFAKIWWDTREELRKEELKKG